MNGRSSTVNKARVNEEAQKESDESRYKEGEESLATIQDDIPSLQQYIEVNGKRTNLPIPASVSYITDYINGVTRLYRSNKTIDEVRVLIMNAQVKTQLLARFPEMRVTLCSNEEDVVDVVKDIKEYDIKTILWVVEDYSMMKPIILKEFPSAKVRGVRGSGDKGGINSLRKVPQGSRK